MHTVIIEITGLNKIFVESLNFLVLLSKLEGISEEENFENVSGVTRNTISKRDNFYELYGKEYVWERRI